MESQRYTFELLSTPTATSVATPTATLPASAIATPAAPAGAGGVSGHDLILFFHRVIQEKKGET